MMFAIYFQLDSEKKKTREKANAAKIYSSVQGIFILCDWEFEN